MRIFVMSARRIRVQVLPEGRVDDNVVIYIDLVVHVDDLRHLLLSARIRLLAHPPARCVLSAGVRNDAGHEHEVALALRLLVEHGGSFQLEVVADVLDLDALVVHVGVADPGLALARVVRCLLPTPIRVSRDRVQL